MVFDGEKYGDSALIEELLLIERHSKDGSAVEGSCSCIQDKHMKTLIGLSKESIPLTESEPKRSFYHKLHEWGERRLKDVFALVKSNPSKETAKAFYDVLAVESRDWRINIDGAYFTEPESVKTEVSGGELPHNCGCVGCPPCEIEG